MRKILPLVISGCIIFLSFSKGFSQETAVQSITENDLRAHLDFLASDLLQGRRVGTPVPGLDIAAEYIRASASRIGLLQSGNDLAQKFNLISVRSDPENTYLMVSDQQGKTLVKSDSVYTFFGGSDDLTLEGKIVFAGYGWQDTLTGYNDLEGLDVKDKLVMILPRNREMVMKGETSGSTGRRGGFQIETGKIQRITQAGAKGIILIDDPDDTGGGMISRIMGFGSRASYSMEGQQESRGSRRPGNMFYITPGLANSILSVSGKSLQDLQKQINQSGKPASFELPGVTGKINLTKLRQPVPVRNIVGIVEGSDPILKNECVIYLAHYDHLGLDLQGNVYNGADDNASGVAGLLEIAEAFQKLEKKPKRSIVFAWVTGEEIGLLGSLWYAMNPVFPMEKTVACINLDMIGRVKADNDTIKSVRGEKYITGRNGVYVISGGRSAELDSLNSKISAKMGLVSDGSMSQGYINRSDYAHFHRRGIPILGYSTGVHADYHTITDDIEKIDFPKMKVVTELAFRTGYAVADQQKRIIVDKPLENR